MLRLEGNYVRWEQGFDKAARPDDSAFRTEVDSIFAETQAKVHIISGALKGSGKMHSDTSGDRWHAEMTWGGPSPGFLPRAGHPETEVVYAWYEMRRGGAHDWLSDHDIFEDRIGRAVRRSFE